MVLASMKAITTKRYGQPGTEFGDAQPKARMRQRHGVREWTCPWSCYQILIRRRLQTVVLLDGYEYRALMPGVNADGHEKKCHKKYNWVALPDKGWEFAPDTPEIRRDIVASHPWSTDILVLASMKGIRTKQWIEQSVSPGTEFGDDQPKALMRTKSGVREWTCPWECYQILIRRRLQVAATVVKRNLWKLHGSPSGSIRWDHKVGAWSLDNKYNQAWFESNQLGEMAPPISQTWSKSWRASPSSETHRRSLPSSKACRLSWRAPKVHMQTHSLSLQLPQLQSR